MKETSDFMHVTQILVEAFETLDINKLQLQTFKTLDLNKLQLQNNKRNYICLKITVKNIGGVDIQFGIFKGATI